MLHSVELCAGAGGQALGLHQAGFLHEALVDNDAHACRTLESNRERAQSRGEWRVIEGTLQAFLEKDARRYKGVDLVAGGVPCPPFSVAGKQLGHEDERDLFPTALKIVSVMRPQAVMLENVRGLLDAAFEDYRTKLDRQLRKLGYEPAWALLNASEFGVPQLRPRVVIVAVQQRLVEYFSWPDDRTKTAPPTVGEALYDLMAERGWKGASTWRERANDIAPTLVGGSKKHGGPDLGPTRAKRAWATLGVDGHGLADAAPTPSFSGRPKLTVRMAARLQGFPDDWEFTGGKTAAYRQVGNAFPPPVAKAVALKIRAAIYAAARASIVLAA